MKVQCLLFRSGGTVVTLGQNTYHFQPLTASGELPHVATVDDEDDLGTLLSVPEAYRLYRAPKPQADRAAAVAPLAPAPVEPAPVVTEDGEDTDEGDDEDPDEDDTDEQDDATGDGSDDASDEDPAQTGDTLESMSIEDLRKAFENEVGRKPGPRALPETMIAQIKAARDGE